MDKRRVLRHWKQTAGEEHAVSILSTAASQIDATIDTDGRYWFSRQRVNLITKSCFDVLLQNHGKTTI